MRYTVMVAPMILGAALALTHAASPDPRAEEAQIDHLIVGIRDLGEGVRLFEEKTGVRPVIGGEHPGRGTRNALVSLGSGHYIEILAPQEGAPDDERVRLLRTIDDLTPMGWALSARDLEASRRRLEAAGFGLSPLRPGSRERPDGAVLQWTTFEVTRPAVTGAPFFIRWGDGTTHPSQDSPGGCRLERLQVGTPQADDLRRLLAAVGVDAAVETAAAGAMEMTLACPRGTVRLGGRARQG